MRDRAPIAVGMTNPPTAAQVSTAEEDTVAAHLIAIAEMHATALAHIATVTMKPPTRAGAGAAA